MKRLGPRIWMTLVAVCMVGLGGCDWGSGASSDTGVIDSAKISVEDPGAEQPVVEFHCLTEDSTLNHFINKSLTACAEGDYDSFRTIFATSQRPPEREDFKRIWHGVQGIFVQSVHGPYRNKEDQPTYYVHALVRLRQPDSKDRTKRDAVVAVFKEGSEWRLGSAPQGVIRKILAASTQPGPGSRPESQPASAAPRPVKDGGV